MKDKKRITIFIIVAAAVILLTVFLLMPSVRKKRAEKELLRAFSSGIMENAEVYVPDETTARKLIRAQGQLLRSTCEDNGIRDIEKYLEKTYGMEAVNLRDMDEDTAGSVKDACDYMYGTYPILNGYLTNITLQDDVSESDAAIALFETNTYIINPSSMRLYPIVIKKQILLRAKSFENPRRLENTVNINVRDGFWTEGTDVTAVLVHELGHALISCILSHKYGLDNTVFVDENNADAYSSYNMEQLSDHQDFVKSICENAYAKYKEETGESDSYEDFCGQISGYAKGIQDDGGISYEETVAEAISNVYVHGGDCALPAALIVEEIDSAIKEFQ